jgi:HSP20 family protein
MITRRDPSREGLSLRRMMEQLLEQSFVNPSWMPAAPSLMVPMDVCETPDGYEVDVALPGVRPEDIELLVDQNSLTVRGRYSLQNEHENQPQGQTQGQQQTQPGQTQGESSQQQSSPQAVQHDGGQQTQQIQRGRTDRHRQGHNWLSREIVSGTFERTIVFPRPIDVNKVQTNFQNGILTILLPVSEASRPKRISITGGQGQQKQVPVEAGRQQG